MSPLSIYELLVEWKDKSYLSSFDLTYREEVYAEVTKEFIGDYQRWFPSESTLEREKLLLTPQLHPVLTYRIARRLFLLNEEKEAQVLSLLGRIHGQIEIYFSAHIGTCFKINHGVGSVIGARCILGDHCTIHQQVTLGDKAGGRPTLGDNVVIYPGSVVLGAIHIGSGSIIGAHSLVLSDFPEQSIIVGSPAINKKI